MEKLEKDALDLGKLNVYKLFSKYFFPTLLGMLSISALTAIDGIFIGHGVGGDGIAAVNICVPLYMLCTGLALMIGAGSSVVASIHLSQGKPKAARLNVTQAVLFVTLLTLIPSLWILCNMELTARLLGSSDELLPLVIEYLHWFVPAMVFQVWVSVGLFIVRLDGSPNFAMCCSVVTSIVNFVLDWLFIFPFGWGLMGAAFASSLSMAIGGIMAMAYLAFKAEKVRFIRLKWSLRSWRYSMRNIGYQCRIGLSAFVGEMTMAALALIGNYIFMQYLGNDGVGAFGIACYYTPFVFMVGNAIAQSAQPIISYNYGLKMMTRVASTLRIALGTAVVCGLIVMYLFMFDQELLVGLFLRLDSPVSKLAIEGFPYFAVGFIFFIVNLTVIGYFQSIERVKPALFFALLRGFFFLMPSFILLPKLLATPGIWLAMPLSEALTTLFILLFYLWDRNKRTI